MADWRDRMTPEDHATIAARAPITPGTLVVLIGPAGAGKTQFTHGVPSREVISLDELRALVNGGDAGDQATTAEAVQLQDLLLDARLRRNRTVYCDSTSLMIA
ncbi:AAA family ATPase [Kitasatospora sp. NPDC004669]|uniref:AAA family ATPase n=1 Tax=Kitasatospora sp. NPDC004669 TaxID=3154555 RepID=UPI0033AEBCA6